MICIIYKSHLVAGSSTVCISAQGVMAEAESQTSRGHGQVLLTKYSTTVPGNEFTRPGTPTSIRRAALAP